MKKLNNSTKVVLGLTALAGLSYLFGKKIVRGVKNLEQQEKEEDEELLNAGVADPHLLRKLRNQRSEMEEGAVYSLFLHCFNNTAFEDESLSLSKVYGNKSFGEYIHVAEHPFKNDHYLDFLLEIPTYGTNSGELNRRDYINSLNELADDLTDVVKGANELPNKNFEGFLWCRLKPAAEGEEPRVVMLRIDRRDTYERYAKNNHDGLLEFCEAVRNGIDNEDLESILSFLRSKGIKETDILKDGDEYEFGLDLYFRISFPLPTEHLQYRINFRSAIECLSYILDEWEVKKASGYGKRNKYRGIVFHAPVENQERLDSDFLRAFKYSAADAKVETVNLDI